jgi:hypothetical protein
LIYGYNDNAIFNTLKTNLETAPARSSTIPGISSSRAGRSTRGAVSARRSPGRRSTPTRTSPIASRTGPAAWLPDVRLRHLEDDRAVRRERRPLLRWDNGTQFRENSVGTATDFQTLTNGKTGLFFFDTADGIAPHDFDASKVASNLTPQVDISANGYNVRGFLYLNANNFSVSGTPGARFRSRCPASRSRTRT